LTVFVFVVMLFCRHFVDGSLTGSLQKKGRKMKKILTVAIFGFVSFAMVALVACEDHVRERDVQKWEEIDGAVEVEDDEEFEVDNDVGIDDEEVEEVEADNYVDSIDVEAVDGDDTQACDLFAMRTVDSPFGKVVPLNARGLDLFEMIIVAREQFGISGLVFEQFGAGGDNTAPLRISSKEFSVYQEAEVIGRIATFVFEQEVMTIKDGYIHFMLETDLDGSMKSGDVLGYRLIEVITTDGACVDGLPVESNIFFVSQVCSLNLTQEGSLQFLASALGCVDLEVRKVEFSISNLTGFDLDNFTLKNALTGEVLAGPVSVVAGVSSFVLQDSFLVRANEEIPIQIVFDAEPGEVNISLDSVIVYDVDKGTETFPWGDLPFVWNYTGQ